MGGGGGTEADREGAWGSSPSTLTASPFTPMIHTLKTGSDPTTKSHLLPRLSAHVVTVVLILKDCLLQAALRGEDPAELLGLASTVGMCSLGQGLCPSQPAVSWLYPASTSPGGGSWVRSSGKSSQEQLQRSAAGPVGRHCAFGRGLDVEARAPCSSLNSAAHNHEIWGVFLR